MTFLELCKKVRQEAGISGTGPLSVVAQTGESKRIVDWVETSWEEIQQRHISWMWLRGDFSFNTVATDNTYSATDIGISARFSRFDVSTFTAYKTALGVTDESYLEYLAYDAFKNNYLYGNQPSGKPICVTASKSDTIILAPIPDDIYTVKGHYYKSPQVLTADADTPEMPAHFHWAIIYRALMKYARYEAASEVYADAKKEYDTIIKQLELNQLPNVMMAAPLV